MMAEIIPQKGEPMGDYSTKEPFFLQDFAVYFYTGKWGLLL